MEISSDLTVSLSRDLTENQSSLELALLSDPMVLSMDLMENLYWDLMASPWYVALDPMASL